MTIIGIELGTSNSAAAALRGGRPIIIPSAEGLSIGGKAFPSYVALTADGQILVGEPARRQATANPEGTVTAFKRKMGKRETIALRGHGYSPEQLSAFLLQKIKRDAEAFLGEPVEKAVVILGVSARDTASGKSQSINITASTRLPENEKRRMVEEAERYADADKKCRDDAEKLNAADSICYEAEKMLANFTDKLTDELKKRIEVALRETKEALLRKEVVLATERAETLKKVLKEAGVVLYSQSGQAQKGGPYAETRWEGPTPQPDVGVAGGEARPSGAGPRGKVVDAEYHENK